MENQQSLQNYLTFIHIKSLNPKINEKLGVDKMFS